MDEKEHDLDLRKMKKRNQGLSEESLRGAVMGRGIEILGALCARAMEWSTWSGAMRGEDRNGPS